MNKNAGFGIAGIVLVIAAIGLAGLVGWRLYDANKAPEGSGSQLAANAPSDQTEQANPSEGYIIIKEWGVRFQPVDGFDDVEHFKPDGVTADSISFTTKSLAQLEPSCDIGSNVLGLLTRTREVIPGYGAVISTIGDYKYQYRAPDVACNKDEANFLAVGQGVSNLLKSLESLEVAK